MYAIGVFVISWIAASSLWAKVPAPVTSVLHRDDTRGLALLLKHTALSINAVVDGYYGYTMLHLAAEYNKVKIMQWLIDNDADVEAIANYHKALPLHTAAKHGNIEAMATLRANHADLEARNMFDRTPLIQAAWSKRYVAVNWLLANGADVNAKGKYGDALKQSLRNGTDKISERLLRAGANVHARYDRNITPLMMAAERGNAKMVDSLVAKGADVNAVESWGGFTPIILAVQGHSSISEETGFKTTFSSDELVPSDNYRQVIEILQNAGADINATDANGDPALFHAIFDVNVVMIRILAAAGADFSFVNSRGEDIFAVARSMFNPEDTQKLLAVFAELGYGSVSAATENNAQVGEQPEYLENLTALAADKDHSPLYGREQEIEQVSNALQRKSLKGVVLVGEPGVGKTAIVEALAYMLAKDELPQLAGREIFKLDVGNMWGREENRFVGQLERHVDTVLKFIVAEPDKRILFIDEIHQLLGGGYIDAYKSAPPITDLLKPYLGRGDLMLIGATTYDEYLDIIERDRAIVERFLRIDIDAPSSEETLKILQATQTSNEEHYDVAIAAEALSSVVTLSERYLTAQQQPRKAVNLLEEALVSLLDDAKQLTEQHIAAVIAAKLNIDVNTILKSTSEKLEGLLPALQKDIYGQDDILADIASRLSVALIGFAAKTRPLAAFLLAGDTGVGKTETAKAFTRYWFGSEDNLIIADMSRFKHPASVAALSELLTRAVKAKPHAVILLDEIEKAHREVHHLLLQLLDEGRLTDNRQRQVDFTNTIIMLTTNSPDIQRDFATEMLNHTYNKLDTTTTTRLIDKQLAEFNHILQENNITVFLSAAAIEILAKWATAKS